MDSGSALINRILSDLTNHFGDRYPNGNKYLAQLTDIERKLNRSTAAEKRVAAEEFANLQRQALIANPLVSGQPIVFVARAQYPPDHHNTATMFQTEEINTRRCDRLFKLYNHRQRLITRKYDSTLIGAVPRTHFPVTTRDGKSTDFGWQFEDDSL